MKKTFGRVRILTGALLALALMLGLGAAPLAGLTAKAADPTPYIVVDDMDTKDHYTGYVLDTAEKQQGSGSLYQKPTASVTIENQKSFDIAYDQVKDWYLEFWVFLEKKSNLTYNKCKVILYQSASVKAEKQLLLTPLSNGWNRVRIKVSDFGASSAFETVKKIQFYFDVVKSVAIRLDDICFVASPEAGDLSGLETAVRMGDELDQTDLSSYDQANVDLFHAALEFAKTRLTGYSQRDVDVAAINLKNAMNAFGMEGYEEDGKATYAFIDFDTMTYSRIDRVAILNGSGDGSVETFAQKGAAAFSGKLQLAVSDEFISGADSRVRIIVTYNNSAVTTLGVNYSSESGVKAATPLNLDRSGSWGRHSATVADAEFTDGIGGNYDFELVPGAGTVYVTRIEIRRIDRGDITEQDPPAFAPMTDANNFADKSVAGYQMWFTATGGWVHWAGGNVPSNDRISFEMWPDISEYPDNVMGQTAFNDLGDGRKAKLFTSVTPEVVDIHVSWMKDAGLDGFAIQRFFGDYNRGNDRDYKNLELARDAAEKYGRVFYVMYDMNGGLGRGQAAADVLKSDFVRNVEGRGIVSSPAYAQMDGKPVVCMWGLDPGSDSYTNFDASMDFINWLHDRGYYVVGGTSNNTWYDGTNSFTDLYHTLDMISPWTVGRYSYNGIGGWMRNNVARALEVCEEYDIDFQPVVLAGGSWHNHNWGMPNDQPHMAGKFLWRQIYYLKNLYHCERVYFAMFDEYDEGTAIMKAARDSYDIPEDEQYFLTLATDGTWLSSDFNLRLAGVICEAMRSDEEVDADHSVPHSEGPLFWRNSFEQRWTYVRVEGENGGPRQTVGVSLQSLDVGLPTLEKYTGRGVTLYDRPVELSFRDGHPYVEYAQGDTSYKSYGTGTEGAGLHCDPGKTRTSNGTWSLQFNGKSSGDADAVYLIARTDIMISAAGLELSYDILADNDLGRYVYADLLLNVNDEPVRLSQYVRETKNSGAVTGSWTSKTVAVPASLVGRKVIGILVGFTCESEGDFNAYLDNMALQSAGNARTMLRTAINTAKTLKADEALTKALTDAAAVQESGSVTDKHRQAAVKVIDAAIRGMDLSAGAAVTFGDVDGDGGITSTDARLVLQLSVDKIDESALAVPDAADVDGDGSITSTDARLILQYSVDKIDRFPVE